MPIVWNITKMEEVFLPETSEPFSIITRISVQKQNHWNKKIMVL